MKRFNEYSRFVGGTAMANQFQMAVSSALAVTNVGLGGQILGNALISVGNYYASEGEKATLSGAVQSAVVGGLGGAIGGSGLNLKYQAEVIRYSKSVLPSFKSTKKIIQFSAKNE